MKIRQKPIRAVAMGHSSRALVESKNGKTYWVDIDVGGCRACDRVAQQINRGEVNWVVVDTDTWRIVEVE